MAKKEKADAMDYVQMFDLKPAEQILHILVCADSQSKIALPKVECVMPHVLPHLPFSDQSFDLVLCPNVLFTDNELQTEHFAHEALLELSRVASEVRVLPLVDKQGMPSKYFGSVLQRLQERGIGMELRHVQAKTGEASAMLRLWNTDCTVKA